MIGAFIIEYFFLEEHMDRQEAIKQATELVEQMSIEEVFKQMNYIKI